MSCYLFFLVFQVHLGLADAEEVRVAVASNFLSTFHEIAKAFEHDSGHVLTISSGSSGKLYAQVKHGAPFDVFFSADVERPRLMEEEGLAVPRTRVTYAMGRLTLWSRDPGLVNEEGRSVLSRKQFEHLAIANPNTAPYGTAAKETMQKLGVWAQVQGKIVQGENIAQTFHFVYSHNAELGFVARAQVMDPKMTEMGSRWDVPPELHAPLRQQAVLLVAGKHNAAAKALLQYIRESRSREIIERFGYGLENHEKAITP